MVTNILFRSVVSIAMAALPTVTSTVSMPPAVTQVMRFQAPKAVEIATEPVVPAREVAVKSMRITVTAYSSTPDQTDSTPFETANGTHVRDGIIAANFLPFHTRVRFPEIYGDKVFTVEDRMNARYAVRADIWMEGRKEAVIFGLKRNVLLEVLPKETVQVAEAK